MHPHKPCRAFTTKYNSIVSQILTDVVISIGLTSGNLANHPQFLKTTALWDTGATHSVITASTAKALGLKPFGQRVVRHAGGVGTSNRYVVNFLLPNQVSVTVVVSECPDIGGFGAIVGMDIIARGDFSISNYLNETWFTFRCPSQARTDFVAEVKKARAPS